MVNYFAVALFALLIGRLLTDTCPRQPAGA